MSGDRLKRRNETVHEIGSSSPRLARVLWMFTALERFDRIELPDIDGAGRSVVIEAVPVRPGSAHMDDGAEEMFSDRRRTCGKLPTVCGLSLAVLPAPQRVHLHVGHIRVSVCPRTGDFTRLELDQMTHAGWHPRVFDARRFNVARLIATED